MADIRKFWDWLLLIFDVILFLFSLIAMFSGIATTEEHSYLFFFLLGCGLDLVRRIMKHGGKGFFCVLMLASTLLSACQAPHDSLNLAVCASYGVPGMMTRDLKGVSFSCEMMDTDTYGRVLFTFCAVSSFTGEEETALVICQAADDENVYFYEDRCYLLGQWDEGEIRKLKTSNDWNLPLNDNKMSCRKKRISADLFLIPDVALNHPEVVSSCRQALGSGYTVTDVFLLDTDETGHVLYQVNVTKGELPGICLAIVNSGYEAALLEWKPDWIDGSALAAFKQENGWTYGIDHK